MKIVMICIKTNNKSILLELSYKRILMNDSMDPLPALTSSAEVIVVWKHYWNKSVLSNTFTNAAFL